MGQNMTTQLRTVLKLKDTRIRATSGFVQSLGRPSTKGCMMHFEEHEAPGIIPRRNYKKPIHLCLTKSS
jgi:hypothetical protein